MCINLSYCTDDYIRLLLLCNALFQVVRSLLGGSQHLYYSPQSENFSTSTGVPNSKS